MESFFPKCFYLLSSDTLACTNRGESDVDGFIEYFRFTYALSTLRKYVKKPDACLERVLVALNVCEKQSLTLDEQLESMTEFTGDLCSDREWAIIDMKKNQLTASALDTINKTPWYKILTMQYDELIKTNSLVPHIENVLSKLKENDP
jgi:hypothetical protein